MTSQTPYGQMLSANPPRTERPISGARVMGWFFFVSSLFWPRVVILTFWIFGSQIGHAFSSWAIPAAGFLIAPWTTMTYALLWGMSSDGVSGFEWLFVALAVLFDVVTWTGGRELFKG